MRVDSVSPIEWAIEMLNAAEATEDVHTALKCSVRPAVQAEGATVVQLDDGQCHYVDEDAMSPLWKGQRFPVESCISGWAMLHDQTVAVADIRQDVRIPQSAYRPTFVRSLLMVPIRVGGSPVGAIGAYWADRHAASVDEVKAMERLADSAGQALARIDAPSEKTAEAARLIAV